MKKALVALCASLAVVGGSVATAPTAAAANKTPGCVTKSEYGKAKKRMTEQQVASIFGTKGRREVYATSGGYASEIRSYKTCSKYSVVTIAFDKRPGGPFRLVAKSAVWVY